MCSSDLDDVFDDWAEEEMEEAEEQAPAAPAFGDARVAEVMPAGISEEDALRMVLEESTRTDDGRYVRELEDAIELSAAVAAHGPPPPAPPLPWWAPVDASRRLRATASCLVPTRASGGVLRCHGVGH